MKLIAGFVMGVLLAIGICFAAVRCVAEDAEVTPATASTGEK